MADFCWECSELPLGIEGQQNDLRGLCEKDEIVHVLCEGCGHIAVDKEGKRWTNTY